MEYWRMIALAFNFTAIYFHYLTCQC